MLYEHSTWMDVMRFAASRGDREWTYIITGRPGPTGKTYLYNMLKKNGYNAFEISEHMFSLVDYCDNKNHYLVDYAKKQVVIVLNKPLPLKLLGKTVYDHDKYHINYDIPPPPQYVNYPDTEEKAVKIFREMMFGGKNMNLEEKRTKLAEHCCGRSCLDCPLNGSAVPCGRGYSFRPNGRMPEDKVLLAYDIVFGGNNMKKEFTKADLKNGDFVKLRDNSVGIVLADIGAITFGHQVLCLNNLNNNLTSWHNSDCDIMAIRRPIKPSDCTCYIFDHKNGELVYERKEVEEMTLEEVCKALGKEIKIVKK